MLSEIGNRIKAASEAVRNASPEVKNGFIHALADALWVERSYILSNNQMDVEEAQKSGLSDALIDRLTLNADRIKGIADDLRSVADLPDPVNEVINETSNEVGLLIQRVRVPLGVLGVIYEARPNVTIDIAGLSIKSGNAVVLRGGSETIHSNKALVKLIHQSLEANGLPADVVQFIDSPDRSLVYDMLQMDDTIDMIIPRGGARLHQFCRENSRIPVMTGGIGICHLFVDESARLERSIDVIRNAKIQRPSVCNALDTVLVHEVIAEEFIPELINRLSEDGVEFRVHEDALGYIPEMSNGRVKEAGATDFDQEWLSLVLGVKTVASLDEAIEHIKVHSTGHSDGILTENAQQAAKFLDTVDSAAVYWNASTRFTDGAQLGLGAEVAVSTQRLHARGPMGLRELTTYKWVVRGDYSTRP